MKAKTIVENKFWILEEENGNKVGTISVKNNIFFIAIFSFFNINSNVYKFFTHRAFFLQLIAFFFARH